MSRSTISTFQLFALFPNEETARVYLEDRLWPSGPVRVKHPDGHETHSFAFAEVTA